MTGSRFEQHENFRSALSVGQELGYANFEPQDFSAVFQGGFLLYWDLGPGPRTLREVRAADARVNDLVRAVVLYSLALAVPQLLPCPRGGITMVLALSEYEHGSGAMLMLDSG